MPTKEQNGRLNSRLGKLKENLTEKNLTEKEFLRALRIEIGKAIGRDELYEKVRAISLHVPTGIEHQGISYLVKPSSHNGVRSNGRIVINVRDGLGFEEIMRSGVIARIVEATLIGKYGVEFSEAYSLALKESHE